MTARDALFAMRTFLVAASTGLLLSLACSGAAQAQVPELRISDAGTPEGGVATFVVTLDQPAGAGGVSFRAVTYNVSATFSDYDPIESLFSIPAGSSSAQVLVTALMDLEAEVDETFIVRIDTIDGAEGVDVEGVGTIWDSSIQRIGPESLPGGTVGRSYGAQLSLTPSDSSETFAIIAGTLPPGLNLAPGGGISGTPSSAGIYGFTVKTGPFERRMSIQIDSAGFPAALSLEVSPTKVAENGGTPIVFTVRRREDLGLDITFIVTPGGTALAGSDYTAPDIPRLAEGASAVSWSVYPINDSLAELNETVSYALQPGPGYVVGTPSQAVGTITNDDIAPTVAIGLSASAVYAGETLAVTFTFSEAVNGFSTADLTVPNGAIAGLTSTDGGVTWSATFTPSANVEDPTNVITLFNSDVASVASGTPGVGTTDSANFRIDTLRPTAVIVVADTDLTLGETSLVTITFSEAVTGFSNAGLTVGSGILSTVSSADGGITWTATLTPPASTTSPGNVITLDNSGVFDVSGNAGAGTTTSNAYAVSTVALALSPAATTFAATYNTAFSQAFVASGGVGPYSYALTGTLPPGLALSGDTITGTPTKSGSFAFTITATDSSTGTPLSVTVDYTIDVAPPSFSITHYQNDAEDGIPYTPSQVTASGGVAPYTFALLSSGLPGMMLSPEGTLSGTPSAGIYDIAIAATDANGETVCCLSDYFNVSIGAPRLTLSPAGGTLNAGYATAYSQVFSASGGVGPYTYAVTAGTLPNGLSFSGDTLSGTATETGSFQITLTATDTGPSPPLAPGIVNYTVEVAAPTITITPATLPDGTAGTAYAAQLTAGGGIGPYTFTVTGGTLPDGLALDPNGTLSGTPTADGSFNFTVTATDANGFTGARAYAVVIAIEPPVAGDVAASVGYGAAATPIALALSGGVADSVAVASAPANGTAVAAGTGITYQPNTGFTGTDTFTYTATNASGTSAPATVTITVGGTTLSLSPGATTFNAGYDAAFSQAFVASGGTGPYSYALTGTLPAGLAFAGDTLSGTATEPGSYPITVTATDSSTGTGAPFSVAVDYTVDVAAPVIAISPGTLPSANLAVAYSQALTASGGVGPYSYAISAGALPAGLALAADGTLSGTPTAAGSFNLTVEATDANGQTGARAYTLVVGATTLALSPGATTFNAGYDAAFSQAFVASGGTGPYSYALTGILPAGLAFAGDTLSGTATEPGSYPITVTATDASTGSGAPFSVAVDYTVDVAAPVIALTPATIPDGTVGTPYAAQLTAAGGRAPYLYVILDSSLFPAGLSFDGNGTFSGTPELAGSYTFTVVAYDDYAQSLQQDYTLVIAVEPPSAGDVAAAVPYGSSDNAIAPVLTGGVADSVAIAAAPANGTATATGTTLSYTPTPGYAGPDSFTYTVTNASGTSAPATVTVTVLAPTVVLSPGATAISADYNSAFSQAFVASGGTGPYSYLLTGSVPAGVTLTGDTLSGTPTEPGSFAFTITATDASTGTGAPFSAAVAYTLDVAAPVIAITPGTLPSGTVGTAYGQALTASGGVGPYAFALAPGSLPAGVSLSAGGTLSGTPTVAGSFAFTVDATDANGQAGAQAYTLAIGEAAPVAVDDSAAVLSGETVTIAVTGNDTGVFTAIAIATAPANGTATVNGLAIDYTPDAGFDGADSFTYTLSGPGGSSAPATVAVTVNPVPVAVSRDVAVFPDTPVQVDLTDGATGGPFTGATLVALSPATSGTAVISAVGRSYVLNYTPAAGFSGVATARFTIDNAFATSAEAVITFTVAGRPDPTDDPEVQGLLDAQVESAKRFATSQIGNFHQRLQQLHRGGGGAQNGIGFSIDARCTQEPFKALNLLGPCDLADGADGLAPMADLGETGAAPPRTPFGFWTGGLIRSGSQDGRDGNADIRFESDGLSAGADYRISNAFALGAGIGWGHDENAIGENGSVVDGDATSFALYASFHPGGRWFLDGVLAYQRLDYDLRRYLTGAGGFVVGQRDGDQWFGSLATGADLTWKTARLTPYARLDMARGTLDAYTEAGHPTLALVYGEVDLETTTGNLGMLLELAHDTRAGVFTPRLALEYQHDFNGRSGGIVRYADLATGPQYLLESSQYDSNRFILSAGAQLRAFGHWLFGLEYRGQVGSSGEADNGVEFTVQKEL